MMDWFYEVCDEMAAWMEHSREAVAGVDLDPPLPTLDKTENFTTVKGNTWYAMPDDEGAVVMHDVRRPQSVMLLRTGEELTFSYDGSILRVVVPEELRTPLPDLVKVAFPFTKER